MCASYSQSTYELRSTFANRCQCIRFVALFDIAENNVPNEEKYQVVLYIYIVSRY